MNGRPVHVLSMDRTEVAGSLGNPARAAWPLESGGLLGGKVLSGSLICTEELGDSFVLTDLGGLLNKSISSGTSRVNYSADTLSRCPAFRRDLPIFFIKCFRI